MPAIKSGTLNKKIKGGLSASNATINKTHRFSFLLECITSSLNLFYNFKCNKKIGKPINVEIPEFKKKTTISLGPFQFIALLHDLGRT